MTEAFFALHHELPRQGPGSDATTRRLLELAGPLPGRPRILDAGCGPGRSALLLAEATGGRVVAVDLHRPFLRELAGEAARRGMADRITTVHRSMVELPFPDGSFDLIWAEGSAYTVGFDTALRAWRRLLAPGGVLVVTEAEWTVPDPAPGARAFWDPVYPLRDRAANVRAARAAGYRNTARIQLPESDWWDEYYTPLARRAAAADPELPGMTEALAATRGEIAVRRAHGTDYHYASYVLRPEPENGTPAMTDWTTRPETAGDIAAVREINLAAFPTPAEADLVDALRADPGAWIDGLSLLATGPDGRAAGFALLTRCLVGTEPALALAPCAVLPDFQRQGAGGAAIRAALDAARALGEQTVVVLGHPGYYPRFGFVPASRFGITAPFDVPDEAFMALTLESGRPAPTGTVGYPAAFGI
ncbi:bifunctional class I SAM-dependent methyltransferase/N-acetyltransferase [Streptomyces sp. NPDC006798]|uniref:bifunctional class I SAM-dependent methyltransferase/N-acetyltransferase n=1 Tax=Streptomyces sp. NPDC006798 TaxID=3155462 RepID=UPI0033E391BF